MLTKGPIYLNNLSHQSLPTAVLLAKAYWKSWRIWLASVKYTNIVKISFLVTLLEEKVDWPVTEGIWARLTEFWKTSHGNEFLLIGKNYHRNNWAIYKADVDFWGLYFRYYGCLILSTSWDCQLSKSGSRLGHVRYPGVILGGFGKKWFLTEKIKTGHSMIFTRKRILFLFAWL